MKRQLQLGLVSLLGSALGWTIVVGADAADRANARDNEQVTSRESAAAKGRIRQTVEYLASRELAGRRGRGGRLAADFIERQFRDLGLEPLFAGRDFRQTIPGPAKREGGPLQKLGANVGGLVRGSDPALRDEIVIVSAHYDHLGARGATFFPGANDNATGVAMMLEVAATLRQPGNRPRRSVAFVAFDLEEHLLWGSRWFVAHPPFPLEKVALFVTADMIGRPLGDLPFSCVFVFGAENSTQVRGFLDRAVVPSGLEVARLGTDMIGTRSDYGPFREHRVPYLFFSTGENPDYHTTRDTAERVNYNLATSITAYVTRICQAAANAPETIHWSAAEPNGIEEARTLHRIASLILSLESKHTLSALQRFLVEKAERRSAAILEAGAVSDSDRSWLVRTTQLLLLSVF